AQRRAFDSSAGNTLFHYASHSRSTTTPGPAAIRGMEARRAHALFGEGIAASPDRSPLRVRRANGRARTDGRNLHGRHCDLLSHCIPFGNHFLGVVGGVVGSWRYRLGSYYRRGGPSGAVGPTALG